MSGFALGLLIFTMAVVVVAGCCRTGYMDRRDDEEYRRLRLRLEQEAAAAALAAKADAEIRAQIVDKLFPKTKDNSQSGDNSNSSDNDGQKENEQGTDEEAPKEEGDDTENEKDAANKEEAKCAICLNNLNGTSCRHLNNNSQSDEPASEQIIQGHSCQHQYHRRCIVSWLLKTSHCPECRQPMWTEDEYQTARQQILAANQAKKAATTTNTNGPTIDGVNITSSSPRVEEEIPAVPAGGEIALSTTSAPPVATNV